MSTHVILIGFMGAGKSTVGPLLASSMERPFIDLDRLIERIASRPVEQIFAEEGEAGFRELETRALEQAVAGPPAVIAAGGGVVEREANVRTMRRRGELVWLRAPLAEMMARAAAQGGRPLLAPGAETERLYRSREPLYGLADVVVDVGGLNPEEAARSVLAQIGPRGGGSGGAGARRRTGEGAAVPPRVVTVDLGDERYEVHVGPGLLDRVGLLAAASGLPESGLLVTAGAPGERYGETVLRSLSQAGRDVARLDIPDGERHKTMATCSLIYDAALQHKIGRDGAFYALGGGVVGDVTGFAAATYLRGVDFVQLPTTLLAQVDASVGGKTGVNLPQGKNLVGAFHQPRLVVADVDVLHTLPARHWAAGWAEVVKYGAIADGPLFAYLEDRRERLASRDEAGLTTVVARSCKIKADIVRQDAREREGVRELLNFGHTVGHGLEALGGYTRWLHGEAVAIGMVTAALLSRRAGGLSDGDVARLVRLLKAKGLPVSPGPVDVDALMAVLARDKKARRGKLRFVLLRTLGSAFVSDEVADEWIRDAIGEQQTL